MTAQVATPIEWSVSSGVPLLRSVASAIVKLAGISQPGDPVYPSVVQRAYDQLVLACLTRGAEPPNSVPAMAEWARSRPVREWPVDLPGDAAAPDEFLVDASTLAPTQACMEWALPQPDPTAEQFEQLLINEAFATCRAASSPHAYTAFRRLLIEKPVLTRAEAAALAGDSTLLLLHETIMKSYPAAPAAYQREGRFVQCARCRCLMVPVRDGRYRCELDRCKRDGIARPGQVLGARDGGGVLQLARPLRMFITGPGLAEIELEAALRKLGLDPEMWPQYDAYDLRVLLPGGTAWAVDVKDRANPALLSRQTRLFPPDPPFARAFLVVPRYRFTDREDYHRVFAANLPAGLKGQIELCSDEQFLKQVRRALRADRRSGQPTAQGRPADA